MKFDEQNSSSATLMDLFDILVNTLSILCFLAEDLNDANFSYCMQATVSMKMDFWDGNFTPLAYTRKLLVPVFLC